MAQEDKLDWIYKGANSLVDREDYLLGRKIDKALEQINEEEKVKKIVLPTPKNHVEHECIPPSIRDFNKIVQFEQVDLSAKLQEDPLVAIKKREEQARRQFLQNPVQLKKLQDALHKKQIQKKKPKKHHKQSKLDKKIKQKLNNLKSSSLAIETTAKHSKRDKENVLNTILMHNFNALKSKLSEGDLQDILNDKVSSSSDDDEKPKAKERSCSEDSGDEPRRRKRYRSANKEAYNRSRDKRRGSSSPRYKYPKHTRDDKKVLQKKANENQDTELDKKIMAQLKLLRSQTEAASKVMLPEKPPHLKTTNDSSSSGEDSNSSISSEADRSKKSFGLVTSNGKKIPFKNPDKPITTDKRAVKKIVTVAKPDRKASKKLTEEEKEKMRREMMQNAKLRDRERDENLKKHRETSKLEKESVSKKYDADLIQTRLLNIAKPTSLEERLKSKANTIQRSSRHMDENFLRRS